MAKATPVTQKYGKHLSRIEAKVRAGKGKCVD
jgi:hypothetical protein